MKCYTIIDNKVRPWIELGMNGGRVIIGSYRNTRSIFLSNNNPPDREKVEVRDNMVIANANVAQVGDEFVFIDDRETRNKDDRILVVTSANFTVVKGGFKTVMDVDDQKLVIADQYSVLKFTGTDSELLFIVGSGFNPFIVYADEIDAYLASLKTENLKVL